MATRCFIANMVAHRRRSRREDRNVGAPLVLELQLGAFETFADLIVGYVYNAFGWDVGRVLQSSDLAVPVGLELFRRCCVMSVAVDDHNR